MCFEMNKHSQTFEKTNGEFLKFCHTCIPHLNNIWKDFQSQFDNSKKDCCLGCNSDMKQTKVFHPIKNQYFCTKCVLKGVCICNKCIYPVLSTKLNNRLVSTWNRSLTFFMTFKKLYPNMSMDLKAFLGRELTYLELQVETELISLDPDETHDKIAFFPNVSIGDCSNLIVNVGVEEIYVKQTVMNFFFKLLERKSIHSPDQPFVYFVNNGNLSVAMESLFSKKKYGIFD